VGEAGAVLAVVGDFDEAVAAELLLELEELALDVVGADGLGAVVIDVVGRVGGVWGWRVW
jgi:hypothetical protein